MSNLGSLQKPMTRWWGRCYFDAENKEVSIVVHRLDTRFKKIIKTAFFRKKT